MALSRRPCAMSNERVPRSGLPAAPHRPWRASVLAFAPILAAAILVAACTVAASPSVAPTSGPSASPVGSPPIERAMGGRDVVLRFEEGGGFVAASFLAVQVPYFTLYGDGTVIYRPATEPPPSGQQPTSTRPRRRRPPRRRGGGTGRPDRDGGGKQQPRDDPAP